MPGLQPGWTRMDTQHFPILTINEKLSMLYILEALRHYTECQDLSLGEPERIHNISLYWPWMKSSVCYISQKRSDITQNARTSAWVNQKGYITFPFIDHEWKAKYVTYPRSAQALYWMPGLQPGWTRKDTQHFPILTMTEKLGMLYIPEALRHLLLNARTSAWNNQKGYTTGWTRKNT